MLANAPAILQKSGGRVDGSGGGVSRVGGTNGVVGEGGKLLRDFTKLPQFAGSDGAEPRQCSKTERE